MYASYSLVWETHIGVSLSMDTISTYMGKANYQILYYLFHCQKPLLMIFTSVTPKQANIIRNIATIHENQSVCLNIQIHLSHWIEY